MKALAAHTRQAARWMPASPQIISAGLLLTAAVVLAQTLGQGIDFHFFDLSVKALDSGHHRSIFGVVSILAEAAAGGAIGLRAASRRSLPGLCAGAVVGVLIVPRGLMSAAPAFKHNDVLITVAPLMLASLVVCAMSFRDPKRVRVIVWGSLLLLGCSFALHAVGPLADGTSGPLIRQYTWPYQLTGMLKHGAEVAGWMLLATGMLAGVAPALQDNRPAVRGIGAVRPLPAGD